MDQPTNLMVITSATVVRRASSTGTASARSSRTRLVDRYPRFRQRVVEGRGPLAGPHWEDDPHFDLDLHLHRVALPAPGDQAALEALRRRPAWPSRSTARSRCGTSTSSTATARGRRSSGASTTASPTGSRSPGSCSRSPTRRPTPGSPPGNGDGGTGGGPGIVGALIAPAARRRLGAARGAAGAVAHEAIAGRPRPLGAPRPGRHGARRRRRRWRRSCCRTPRCRPRSRASSASPTGWRWSAPIPLDDVKAFGHATVRRSTTSFVTAVAGAFRALPVRPREPRRRAHRDRPLQPPASRQAAPRRARQPLRPRLPAPARWGSRTAARGCARSTARMEEIKHSPEGAISYGVLEAIGRTPVEVETRLVDLFSASGHRGDDQRPGPARARLPGRDAGAAASSYGRRARAASR